MLARAFLRAGAASVAVAIMTLVAIDVAIAQGNINQATLTEPDQNVSYFPGMCDALAAAVKGK